MTEHWVCILTAAFPWLLFAILQVSKLIKRKREKQRRKLRHAGHRRPRDGRDHG